MLTAGADGVLADTAPHCAYTAIAGTHTFVRLLLLWLRQRLRLLASSADRNFLCLLSCHEVELGLHFPLTNSEKVKAVSQTSQTGSSVQRLCVFRRAYRQLSRFTEGPPASGSFLLEDGDFLCPVRQHVHLASLGGLCPPREAMEVQLQRTYTHTQQSVKQSNTDKHGETATYTHTHPGSRQTRASRSPRPAEGGWQEASVLFYPKRKCFLFSSRPQPV